MFPKHPFLCSALLASALLTGCASHVGAGYRVYDPYYTDYHVWGPPERVYYNQWIVENHRPHREYRRLRREEQREYWNWRHGPGRERR